MEDKLARLRDPHLGGLFLHLDPQDVGAEKVRLLVQSLRHREHPVESVHTGLGEPRRLASGQGVDIRRVEVADLQADRVLVLRLEHVHGPLGHDGPCLALAGEVERLRDVDVVLGRPARSIAPILPIGDELAVGVEDRVGAQARGQDVGPGLRDLEPLRAEVEVVADEPLERLVEGQTVGGPLVLGPLRQRQGSEDIETGDRQRSGGRRCPGAASWRPGSEPGRRDRGRDARERGAWPAAPGSYPPRPAESRTGFPPRRASVPVATPSSPAASRRPGGSSAPGPPPGAAQASRPARTAAPRARSDAFAITFLLALPGSAATAPQSSTSSSIGKPRAPSESCRRVCPFPPLSQSPS